MRGVRTTRLTLTKGVSAMAVLTRGTRDGVAWSMRKASGVDRYRSQEVEVNARLNAALVMLHAALQARDEEIRRLRAEVERLRDSR